MDDDQTRGWTDALCYDNKREPTGNRPVIQSSTPIKQGVIAEAAEMSYGVCLEAVDILRKALFVQTKGPNIADRVEPYHDRVLEALVSRLDMEIRCSYYRRLGNVLEKRAEDARDRAAVARYLEEAGEFIRAAQQAEQAAEEAANALAFDQVAELYNTALRLGKFDATIKARLLRNRAEALRDAGRGREAAEAFMAAASLLPEEKHLLHLKLQAAAVDQLIACGHLKQGLSLMEQLFIRLGMKWPQTQAEALAMFVWERAILKLRGLSYSLKEDDKLNAEDKIRIEICLSLGIGLGSVDSIRAWTFLMKVLRRSLNLGDRDLLAMGFSAEALMLALEGKTDYSTVRGLVAEAASLVAGTINLRAQAMKKLADGGTYFMLGRIDLAHTLIDQAEAFFRDKVRVDLGALNVARIIKVWTAVFRGDFRLLKQWIPEYERDAIRRDDRYAQVSLNLAGHVGWLIDDNFELAQEKIQIHTWDPPSHTYHFQHW